jgi:hypothetical protein
MQTVRGILQTTADPDLVYDILVDYDSCSRVFRNISGSQTLFTDAGDKQVIQVGSSRVGQAMVHTGLATTVQNSAAGSVGRQDSVEDEVAARMDQQRHRHTVLTKCAVMVVFLQACKWQFLAFKGTFNVHLNVLEAPHDRLLVFTLAESSFMRDFEGRWQVRQSARTNVAASARVQEKGDHSGGAGLY